MRFRYPCPDCRTTNSLHDPDCRFDGTPWHEVERAYVDILSLLVEKPRQRTEIHEAIEPWDALHKDALGRLVQEQRIQETASGAYELLSPPEFKEMAAVPTPEPLKIIYERGSVSGCHDHAVFSLIAYYEMIGFTWEETRERVVDWLRDSGTWARGGFEENSPEAVVDAKQHVYTQGYGWRQSAQEAAAVIRRRG